MCSLSESNDLFYPVEAFPNEGSVEHFCPIFNVMPRLDNEWRNGPARELAEARYERSDVLRVKKKGSTTKDGVPQCARFAGDQI